MLKEDFFKVVEDLQTQIKECKDDYQAIALQKELIDFLSKNLENKEFIIKNLMDLESK